jgi:microcystin-dependent protein
MAIDFPNSPITNEIYTSAGRSWQYDGEKWINYSSTSTTITLPGSTSGNVTLKANAVAGSAVITFPATTGNVITTGDTETVTSTMIANSTIINADISTSAAIALSKLASGSSGQVVLANSTGVPTYTAISGDIAIDGSGVVTIQANSVALGTDTTGNYMSNVSAGTGISVSHTPAEGSTATVSVDTAYSGFAPIGSVMMWSGTSANIPSGWALCNGAALSTTTYASLYSIIGTRYGSGTGTFLLPDFTSRLPKGITGVPTVPSTITSSASSAVDVHTHGVNSTFTAGNVNSTFSAGNTSNESNYHQHFWIANFTTGGQNADHSHSYYKPNSGANNNTGGVNAGHTHNFNTINGADQFHTHSVNSSFSAGSVNSSLTAGNASTINASTPAHTHTNATVEILFIIRVS